MRAQDEVQHWRRIRKQIASLLGDARRDNLTWREVKDRLTELEALAQEREKAWIAKVLEATHEV